jgi:hypothetical protein
VFKSEFRNTHFSYVLGTEGVELPPTPPYALTIVTACPLYVLEGETSSKPIGGPIIFESSQINGRDGNDSHHTPCGP